MATWPMTQVADSIGSNGDLEGSARGVGRAARSCAGHAAMVGHRGGGRSGALGGAFEGIARSDVPWPAYTIALSIVRSGGAVARAVPVGDARARLRCADPGGVGPALAGLDYGVLNATAVVLLFPYPWRGGGSGRHIVIGVVVLMVGHFVREPLYGFGLQENLIGAGFLLFPVARRRSQVLHQPAAP